MVTDSFNRLTPAALRLWVVSEPLTARRFVLTLEETDLSRFPPLKPRRRTASQPLGRAAGGRNLEGRKCYHRRADKYQQ